eukprot:TRINITY_DN2626_c0_g1::TRINITY_DN2626_c0_g1_i1::g.25922::m.25922 TRINITY_DN2626_c0_g1::TRINITY_DN2626_c0_g1_i1::g.25922  ORF type:complete len:1031 (+),score=379.43,sp/Q92896/GSLG1_HUMAN/24.97/8e-63,sp/Q92896/GSLG1_HUMAN/22.61/2e-58,sp/Q92896/GSLG1_HUMAN/26.18/7e-54,sp/Q92896/GSLG1_HUMAN/25.39/4e-19,Cys_rich_FGFR/PF00839.12/47,Cys_rich_FGFR/PF00839.12/1.7e-08,Cys_rich_FGFR/PF00839.12/2.1e-11,Cys_rich_FGFR/PF00839.12/2.3e-12,Cys_rich_FGFR/PF00839.12/1.8e-12,Cys_rich_FGFR/PF00839.12/0.011,Cys_rich_
MRSLVYLFLVALLFVNGCAADEHEPEAVDQSSNDLNVNGTCKTYIEFYCKEVQPGSLRVYDCMKIVKSKPGITGSNPLSSECKKEIDKFRADLSQSSYKNVHMMNACKTDMPKYCPNVPKLKGKMLDCLRKHKKDLTDACKQQVTQEAIEAAQNIEFDAALNEACGNDASKLCAGVEPGEGRVISCLRSKRPQLSDSCKVKVEERMVQAAEDIRLNYPLAKACENEIRVHCQGVTPGNARIFECLADNRESIDFGAECTNELFKQLELITSDARFDYLLQEACKDDIKKKCASEAEYPDGQGNIVSCLWYHHDEITALTCKNEVHKIMELRMSRIELNPALKKDCDIKSPELLPICGTSAQGQVQQCLWDNRDELPWACYESLIKVEQMKASDIHFNPEMFKVCSGDVSRYCKDLPHGEGRILECLSKNHEQPDFTSECRALVYKDLGKKAESIHLNVRLYKACEKDLVDQCDSADDTFTDAGTALECLYSYLDRLQSQECKDKVHDAMAIRLTHFDLNPSLKAACEEDRQRHCPNEDATFVQQCLRQQQDVITSTCADALKENEYFAVRDYHFDPVLVKACQTDIPRFCKDVPHGQGRVIECLSEHKTSSEMTAECKTRVRWLDIRKGTDYRLNPLLERYCLPDIIDFCDNEAYSAEEGEGNVLGCLKEKRNQLKSAQCKQQVFSIMKKSSEDIMTDAKLVKACNNEINTVCHDVGQGEGRIRECLNGNKDKLGETCKTELRKSAALSAEDIRLKYQLNQACLADQKTFCGGVEPGNARMLSCLQSHMEDVTFSSQCRERLISLFKSQATDATLDYRLMQGCRPDMEEYCAAEMEKASKQSGEGIILTCLLSHNNKLQDACDRELGRMIWTGLRHYEEKAPLTRGCDEDVHKQCSALLTGKPKIGTIHKCLIEHQKSLRTTCKTILGLGSQAATETLALQKAHVANSADGSDATGTTGESSFLVIRGPMALASIAALVMLILGTSFYIYRSRNSPASKGYIAAPFVPKDI